MLNFTRDPKATLMHLVRPDAKPMFHLIKKAYGNKPAHTK